MTYNLIIHIYFRSAESSDCHNHLGIQAMEELLLWTWRVLNEKVPTRKCHILFTHDSGWKQPYGPLLAWESPQSGESEISSKQPQRCPRKTCWTIAWDDSDQGRALCPCGGVKMVRSSFRVTPRVTTGRSPLLCCALEGLDSWRTACGEMCWLVLTFKAFVCNDRFLVSWTL